LRRRYQHTGENALPAGLHTAAGGTGFIDTFALIYTLACAAHGARQYGM